MNKYPLDLLYRSFDCRLSDEEQKELEQALIDSSELREEKERITALRSALTSSNVESFRSYFTNRVIQKVEALESSVVSRELFFDSLIRLFRPIAVAGIAAALILITLNLSGSDEITLAAAFGVSEEGVEELMETPLEYILEE
jgi:hypothetical protein